MFFLFIDHVPVMSSGHIRKLVLAGFSLLKKIFYACFFITFRP